MSLSLLLSIADKRPVDSVILEAPNVIANCSQRLAAVFDEVVAGSWGETARRMPKST